MSHDSAVVLLKKGVVVLTPVLGRTAMRQHPFHEDFFDVRSLFRICIASEMKSLADWVRRSTAPLRDLTPTQQYGYLWNSVAYDYHGRKIRAFFAGGNGGQVSMGIPDLDLVIAFTGGNYNDPVLFTGQRVYVPRYILPAVK